MPRSSCLVLTLLLGLANGFLLPTVPTRRSIVRMHHAAAPSTVTVDSLKRVVLRHPSTGHEATVHLHGGCVTSYKAPHEVLAIRKDAVFDGSKPIAGGLQICWPQFGPGKIQQHGFARNLPWELHSQSTSADGPEAVLSLTDSDATRAIWDTKFKVLLTVKLDKDALTTKFQVQNTDMKPFDFTLALHSYYTLSHVSNGRISGDLAGASYLDKTKNPPESVKLSDPSIAIDKFLEGVLPGLKGPVSLEDKGRGTVTSVEHVQGYDDYILWNPYGNEGMGYDNFVCVESGKVTQPVTLVTGAEWVGEMKIVPKKA